MTPTAFAEGLHRGRSRKLYPLGRGKVHTAHLVDTDEHVNRVLPKLREMAAHRLIVRENVVIEQGSSD
jgi:hypothetical protein